MVEGWDTAKSTGFEPVARTGRQLPEPGDTTNSITSGWDARSLVPTEVGPEPPILSSI